MPYPLALRQSIIDSAYRLFASGASAASVRGILRYQCAQAGYNCTSAEIASFVQPAQQRYDAVRGAVDEAGTTIIPPSVGESRPQGQLISGHSYRTRVDCTDTITGLTFSYFTTVSSPDPLTGEQLSEMAGQQVRENVSKYPGAQDAPPEATVGACHVTLLEYLYAE